MYCSILYSTLLYYYTILYYILWYTILYDTLLYYTVLFCTALYVLSHCLHSKAWPDCVYHCWHLVTTCTVRHGRNENAGAGPQSLLARQGIARLSWTSCGRTGFSHVLSIIRCYCLASPCLTFRSMSTLTICIIWRNTIRMYSRKALFESLMLHFVLLVRMQFGICGCI